MLAAFFVTNTLKTCLPYVIFIAEQTNPPELVDFVQQSIDVNHVHVKLHLVEFLLQMVTKMLQLFM